MAPGMLPRPPITQTIRPLTVIGTTSRGESTPTEAPIMAPASPPKRPVMTKVSAFVRSRLMPASWAATGCCATARVAMPRRVR